MYRPVLRDEMEGGTLIGRRRAAIACCAQRLVAASLFAATLALTAGCLLGIPVLARGPRPADLSRPAQLFLAPVAGAIGDSVSQLAVEGISRIIPNPLDGNGTLGGVNSIEGVFGSLSISGDPNPFAENFSLSASVPNLAGGNFTFNTGAAQVGEGLALGSQALAPLGNFSSGVGVPNPFPGDMLGGAIGSLHGSNPFAQISAAGAASPFAHPGQALDDAVAGANAMNPFNGNASAEDNPWAGPLNGIAGIAVPFNGNNLTLAGALGEARAPLDGIAGVAVPFNGNLTVAGALGEAQGALAQAGATVANTHPEYWPTYLDGDNEYYDNDTAIAGSWHWPTCDREHMYKCPSRTAEILNACCCDSGFAYVQGNAGAPIAQDVASGATIGAAHGAVVTGAMLGGDMGSSTATGAATGAASGAITGAVMYLFEGGECKAKSALSEAVQEHLS